MSRATWVLRSFLERPPTRLLPPSSPSPLLSSPPPTPLGVGMGGGMGGGLGRFASNYRDWDPTDELDRQEHDRKILDDFFQGGEAPEMGTPTAEDGEYLKDEAGILDNFSKLKEKQEEERMAELGLRPPRNKFFKAPENKTREIDEDDGGVYSHGAEVLNERTHSYFNSAPPVPITKRRERRQERAHKLLLDNMEKAKQKKRRLYRRDVQDYSKTRRQLRMDNELFQTLNDALGFDQNTQPLRDANIVLDDVKVSVSMRKARIYWSLALADDSEEKYKKALRNASHALAQYGSALRFATQQRIQMKRAPELEFVYSEMKNPRLIEHLDRSMKIIDHLLAKQEQEKQEKQELEGEQENEIEEEGIEEEGIEEEEEEGKEWEGKEEEEEWEGEEEEEEGEEEQKK